MKSHQLTARPTAILLLLTLSSCSHSSPPTPQATTMPQPIAAPSFNRNLLLNPDFEFITNGDGKNDGNTAPNLRSPIGSYTIGTGPDAEFHGLGTGPNKYPANGTATVTGRSSSGFAGVQYLDSYLFHTSPNGPCGYTNGGDNSLYQTLPSALQPNTLYTLRINLYARTDAFPTPDMSLFPLCVVQLRDGNQRYLAGTANPNGPNIGVYTSEWSGGMGTLTLRFTTGSTLPSTSKDLIVYLAGDYQMNYRRASLHAISTNGSFYP